MEGLWCPITLCFCLALSVSLSTHAQSTAVVTVAPNMPPLSQKAAAATTQPQRSLIKPHVPRTDPSSGIPLFPLSYPASPPTPLLQASNQTNRRATTCITNKVTIIKFELEFFFGLDGGAENR